MHVTPDLIPATNRAMASVLLLYYHLLREGGIWKALGRRPT